jgi:eukaryotic-like serine/threonine-protein kinase
MATKRVPAQPPGLMGYDPIKLIGTGGYADVYLYEQQLPKRQVAVKVLIADALGGTGQRAAFTAEANLMARVSAHPYIVQIFQADIAADGRPYLVMEYYPGQNYYERAKRERMAVADVLRTGVQLASAVETAHVAGILHRDIKPANVLTSEFRRPGLTDFGIASAQGPQSEAAEGLSIPWSPPESFGDGVLGVRADVYSLAATLYTLLCGRSPFEIPGGDNSGLSMISRIERNPVPPTGRTDVPASLERLLGQAMAKNPAHRPETAVALARQIQQIESELKLGVTALELAAAEHQTVRTRDELPDDDSTRIKGIVEIQAQTAPRTALIDRIDVAPVSAAPIVRAREGLLAEPEVDHTVHRSPEVPVARVEVPEPKKNRSLLIAAGTVLAVGAIGIGVAMANGGGSSADKPSTFDTVASGSKTTATVAIAVPEQVAPFSGVADASGTFTFTWLGSNGAPASYVVTEIGSTKSPVKVADTKYTARTTCIDVETLAESGTLSAPVRGCAK